MIIQFNIFRLKFQTVRKSLILTNSKTESHANYGKRLTEVLFEFEIT